MNTYITQIIRVGMVLGIALFAFAGEVFAAPTLAPVQVNQIEKTTAVLDGYVESPYKTSIVWFEWGESSSLSPLTTIGLTSIYNGGFFRSYLSGLKSDTTYYYRAVAMEGGTTVYSTIASFKTAGELATTVKTVSSQNTTTNSSATKPVVVAQTKKSTTLVASTKRTAITTSASTTKNGLTNENTNVAAVIGAGDGLLSGTLIGCPRTLIGWIALLIAILIVILLSLMIYESSEKQKKARKAKRIQEGEEAKEEISDIEKILEKNR